MFQRNPRSVQQFIANTPAGYIKVRQFFNFIYWLAMERTTLPDDLQAVLDTIEGYLEDKDKRVKMSNLIVRGEKMSLADIYPHEIRKVLIEFELKKRNLDPENYKAVVKLAELCEFLESKIYQVEPGKRTQLVVLERQLLVICHEIAEQYSPKLKTEDRVKAVTSEGVVMTKYQNTVADQMYLALSKRDYGKLNSPTLKSLANVQNDTRLFKAQKKLTDIPDGIVDLLFPNGRQQVESIPTRRHWKLHTAGIDPQHTEFIRTLAYNHYKYPVILQGICGSGKSHALADLCVTYLKNDPKQKIVICSTNNLAIDSLLMKIATKHPEVTMVRPASQKWNDNLPERLADPNVRCVDIETALTKFQTVQILGLTAEKSISIRGHSGINAGLILLDEAAMSFESHLPSVLTGFMGNCTNVVLAGDIYQLTGLSMSKHARALGIQVSTMTRLMKKDPTYSSIQNEGQEFPNITFLTNCYRGPKEITQLISHFYPFKIKAVPDLEKVNRYVNMQNMPQGHVIYQHIAGTQSRYTNKCPSISNQAEIDAITSYLKILVLQNNVNTGDILIIPYYQKQTSDLRKQIATLQMEMTEKEAHQGILIAGPQKIQGLERPITILSLVQTGKRNLGEFLRDDLQHLVAMSRASSLMIILGDENLMKQHPSLKRILKYKIDQSKIGKKFLKINSTWRKRYIK